MLTKKIVSAILIATLTTTTVTTQTGCATWWANFKADPAAQTAAILNTVQTILSIADMVFGQVKPALPIESQDEAQLRFDQAVLAVQHGSRLLQQAVQTAADQGAKPDVAALIADLTKSIDDLQALVNVFKGRQSSGKIGVAAQTVQGAGGDELSQQVGLLHRQVQGQ